MHDGKWASEEVVFESLKDLPEKLLKRPEGPTSELERAEWPFLELKRPKPRHTFADLLMKLVDETELCGCAVQADS
ncbi:hypothetical protein M378DRAFT_13256 [Amanita muscaria Koide BX008]|uniref:Uncharacterized protein n=1 Tax=Amanita muscaria (strain Koide BX008) TaxID=946122 RepID=A0A0C2WJQ0_AMAMK|nr:hypothetical protein M378DRAFT_13256 [Amanita muscaria Koide BX008]